MSSDKTCFGKFFQHMDIQGLLDRFTLYHIDAPGQVRTLVFVMLVLNLKVQYQIVFIGSYLTQVSPFCFSLKIKVFFLLG